MLGTREYTLCSPFRANAHNSSLSMMLALFCIHMTFNVSKNVMRDIYSDTSSTNISN